MLGADAVEFQNVLRRLGQLTATEHHGLSYRVRPFKSNKFVVQVTKRPSKMTKIPNPGSIDAL